MYAQMRRKRLCRPAGTCGLLSAGHVTVARRVLAPRHAFETGCETRRWTWPKGQVRNWLCYPPYLGSISYPEVSAMWPWINHDSAASRAIGYERCSIAASDSPTGCPSNSPNLGETNGSSLGNSVPIFCKMSAQRELGLIADHILRLQSSAKHCRYLVEEYS